MPLKVQEFEVYLPDPADAAAEPVCHVVRILHIDQLVAETAFTKAHFGMENGMNLTNAWCWAACKRLGLYPKDKPWLVFRNECAGIQAVKGPDGEAMDEDVDPSPRAHDTTSA